MALLHGTPSCTIRRRKNNGHAMHVNGPPAPRPQVTAGIILLSMLGVNVSALLLPAGVAVAIAAKDLSHNFLAGFFLMVVQPFRWAGG